jgi:hypothetical protein
VPSRSKPVKSPMWICSSKDPASRLGITTHAPIRTGGMVTLSSAIRRITRRIGRIRDQVMDLHVTKLCPAEREPTEPLRGAHVRLTPTFHKQGLALNRARADRERVLSFSFFRLPAVARIAYNGSSSANSRIWLDFPLSSRVHVMDGSLNRYLNNGWGCHEYRRERTEL